MIRVVTLDEYDQKHLEKFSKTLYASFGVGAEHTGDMKIPPSTPEPMDAEKLVNELGKIRSFADDKILFLTSRKLKDRQLVSGVAPTQGWSKYGKDRAILSTHGMKDLETAHKQVSRHALHHLGHLWELHHCLDPRCSMYPPWALTFGQGDAIFCTFCREKSEQKIRLATS
ncbi:MAG: hypothetical protein M3Y59_09770 [Myxococcota bacterium]|nr:hypothetical protein [Myxococcota bacterium]